MVLLFSLSTMTTLVYIQFASWKRIEDVDLLKNAIQKQIGLILESYYASGNDDNVNQLVENLKRLGRNLDLHLDLSSQDDYCVDNSQVCDEIYHGNLADLPWHVKAWTLDANCSKPIGHLLTIISIQNGSEFEEETFKSIKRQYPDVAILKASSKAQCLNIAQNCPFINIFSNICCCKTYKVCIRIFLSFWDYLGDFQTLCRE